MILTVIHRFDRPVIVLHATYCMDPFLSKFGVVIWYSDKQSMIVNSTCICVDAVMLENTNYRG